MYVFISQFEYIRFYPPSMTITLEYVNVNVKRKMKMRTFSLNATPQQSTFIDQQGKCPPSQ